VIREEGKLKKSQEEIEVGKGIIEVNVEGKKAKKASPKEEIKTLTIKKQVERKNRHIIDQMISLSQKEKDMIKIIKKAQNMKK